MPPQGEADGTLGEFSWSEIAKHNTDESTWVVIKGEVYDVTNWKNKHPGGGKVLMDSAGQDCTVPFRLYHFEPEQPEKYMKVYKIGQVEKTKDEARERWEKLDEEYDRLTKLAKDMNLFEPDLKFWCLDAYLIWTVVFSSVAIFPLAGFNWVTFILSAVLLSVGQVLGSYHQHSFGHKACTHTKFDRLFQVLNWNILTGFSARFWTDLHARHHIKPNMLDKDPNIIMPEHIFVIGTLRAEQRAAKDKARGYTTVPFNWQHFYWPMVGVGLVIPINYQLASFKKSWNNKHYFDFSFMLLFFVWYFSVFTHFIGLPYTLLHYVIIRNLMSQILTWIFLSNHLVLDLIYEKPEGQSWFEIQLRNTVNLGTSYFSDWFTGYQNWQIEHHLWPHMPPENFRKMAPYVKEVCKKYDLPYFQHSTRYIYANVFKMIRKSGLRWFEVVQQTLNGE